MTSHADQSQDNKSRAAQQASKQQNRHMAAPLADNRPSTTAQRKMQDAINSSDRMQQQTVSQAMIDNSPLIQRASAQQPTAAMVKPLISFQGAADEKSTINQSPAPIQRQWDGSVSKAAKDAEILATLSQMGYSGTNLKLWKVQQLRESKTSYSSYEEIAAALQLTRLVSDETMAISPPGSIPVENIPVESTSTRSPVVEPTSDGRASAESTMVPQASSASSTRQTEPGPSSTAPVPVSVAKSIASRFMLNAEAQALQMAQQRAPTKIDTGRAKIYAPVDNLLTVYRAEKAERNTLDARRAQGGLTIWRPTSTTVQAAYDRMLGLITKGAPLGELEFKHALDAYAQSLRAEGQPDNLATARTTQGAFTDDHNYTISIPGVRLFKWAPGGLGEQILPGAEIKQHYIVLDAATVAESTVFGFGHVTGTQEVSFYSKIPASMITSVQARDFNAERQRFIIP